MIIKPLFSNLPSNWETTTLGEACRRGGGLIQTGPFGSQLHAADYVSVGIPSIMPQNIGDNRVVPEGIARITEEDAKRLSRYLVRKGDIVYSRRGDVERRALITEKEEGWLCGTGCLRVSFGHFDYVDPLYASYYLGDSAVREWIVRHAIGATMPNLNTSILSALPFLLPPLSEQHAIAEVLGALDDKIELNRRMNTTLESIARAQFRQWFVENEEVDDWEVGILGDVIKVNEHSISKYYPHNEIEYIDISSVTTGHLEGTTHYSLVNAPSRARRLVNQGDTIWSTVRPNRRSYLFISNPKENLVVSTGFAVLTPIEISPSFLYFWVTTDEFVDYLVSNADGSAYPAVLPERFAESEIHLPPKAMLDGFENLAGAMLAHIAQNEIESRTLVSLRNSLLPKLMRGELHIKEII